MSEPSSYVGVEDNDSPARGLLTLYVVGKLQRSEIIALIDKAQEMPEVIALKRHLCHLHFGGAGSFDGQTSAVWVEMVKFFLREGFWCTLEMKAALLPLISKTGLCRQARFIPLIRFDLPQALDAGSNATLRLEGQGEGNCWSMRLADFVVRHKVAAQQLKTIGVSNEASNS